MVKKYSLEVVIPIYNEEKELEESIKKLHSFLQKNLAGYAWFITVADNASTDKSFTIGRKISRKLPKVRIIHVDNKGRGIAVKKVWERSKADILAYMDVDLSTDLMDLPPLLQALQKDYDIAIGSRLLSGSEVISRPFKREILSRIYNILIKIFFRTHFSDAQCGFKAVTKRVVKNLLPHIQDNAWFFDSELLIVGEKVGYRIYEEPVVWIDNPGSTVRVLKTVTGDLLGLWRLFWDKPWKRIKK